MPRKLMLKKLGIILLAAGIATLLSSCLVEKDKDVEKLSRKQDNLRIYQDGDYIDYKVTAVVDGTTTRNGNLRIAWANTAPLPDPISTSTISHEVMKETSTLTYDDDPGNEIVSARYISQVTEPPVSAGDPGIGSIILHAIDDEVDEDYWLYPDGSTPSTNPVFTPVIFESPMALGSNSLQSFSVMECELAQCSNEIYHFRDNQFEVVGDSHEVTTNLGIFSNPFQISYQGSTSLGSGSLAVEFRGDIRDICGTNADQIIHSGNMFIIPEIGMIQMTNLCQISSTGTLYTITIRDTSFTY